jgi:hypothetical protein
MAPAEVGGAVEGVDDVRTAAKARKVRVPLNRWID